MDEAVLRTQSSRDWSFSYTLREPLMAQYDNLRGFRSQVTDNVQRIKHLMNALAFRTTSVASDETLCLSALMSFNVQDMLDVKDPDPSVPAKLAEARMTKFWSFFDRVPAAMFKYDGLTLPVDGYGWAPSSLLLSKDRPFEASRSFMISTDEFASRTDKGLNIRLPGLEFHSRAPLGLEFFVEDEQAQFYHFSFELCKFKDQAQKYMHNHSGTLREEICITPGKVTGIPGSDTLVFIFDPHNQLEGDVPAKSSNVTVTEYEAGVIVMINQNQVDGNLDARILGFAVRKTIQAPQLDDAKILRDHIQKSPQNLQDYQNHSLKYPPKHNQTLLCSKGRKLQPRTWRLV